MFRSADFPASGCLRRPIPPLAGDGGVLCDCVRFSVRPATAPRLSSSRCTTGLPASPARPTLSCPPSSTRCSLSRSARPSPRPGRAPLLRFVVPYSVRWPCRAVRCCRHPDDPAAALGPAAPRGPPVRAPRPSRRRPFGTGGETGRSPLRFSACARRKRPVLPCRHGSGTGSDGSCTAAPSRLVFRYPREPSHDLAGVAPQCGTGGAPGVLPFAALLPPAGVAASPPLGPTCRFPGCPHSRRAVMVYVSSGRPVTFHPLWIEGVAVRESPAAAPGLRPRGWSVPRRWPHEPPPRPMPPWALPLSGLRSSSGGLRVRSVRRTPWPCRSWALGESSGVIL